MQNNVFRPGWQFFDDLETLAENEAAEDKRAAALATAKQLRADYVAVFSGQAAERVLADLKRRYVDPDVLQGYFPDGVNTAIKMAERSAEQRLVRNLLTLKKPGEEL
jgi:hypothetical protein